ncbi:MAG: amidoligase family protein [Bacteroidota bacterium]|nr:amidoligase family protein [Bacteroidota bacterium]
MEFNLPKQIYTKEGKLRKAGFELEFGHLDLDAAVACIIELYGGEEVMENEFNRDIINTELGKFCLRADARALAGKTYAPTLEALGINPDNAFLENMIKSVAVLVVPNEVSMPPLPFTDIHKLDKLRELLFENKATDTRVSILNRYATHINIELPGLDPKTILNYLRAFFLLYQVLLKRSDIQFKRKVSGYIQPYPKNYIKRVLSTVYQPDMQQLMNDYHSFNPDRNRPLDLYPLFAFIDRERTDTFDGIGKANARPALHYRLPNSLVDEEGWSLAVEWNRWVYIDDLATSHEINDL